MNIKRITAVTTALIMILSVSVVALEHWSLEFAADYIDVSDTAELDMPITEPEFYAILSECVGENIYKGDAWGISREAACAAIAQYIPEDIIIEEGLTPYSFTDSAEISLEVLTDLERLCAIGVIVGYPDRSFRPKAALTVGEACRLFSALEDMLPKPERSLGDVRASYGETTRGSAASYGETSRDSAAEDKETTEPQLSFTAGMGGQFRSIDLKVSDSGKYTSVYYMILESGSPEPSNSEVLSGNRGIAGRLTDASAREGITLTVTGSNGLMDGFNYDIYMVAASGAEISEVAAVKSVMAMPFAAKAADEDTFIIKELSYGEIDKLYPDLSQNSESSIFYRTARQLENIERLAELYESSDGVHGSEEFLDGGYTYILAGDMNLSPYMSEASGWRPIGTRRSFTGCFDGGGNSISGLYIDSDPDLNGNIEYAGLFGRIRSADIRNLTLNEPLIMVKNPNNGDRYTYVGTLAGESVQSVIEHVRIASPRLSVNGAEQNGMSSAGGVVGGCINSDLSDITVTGADIIGGRGLSDISGGVTGRYYLSRGGKYRLNNLFVSGMLSASGKAGGGIAGTLDSPSAEPIQVFGENIDSLIRVAGKPAYAGGVVGNVGYEALLGSNTRITFDNCYASGMIKATEAAGGLFGKTNAAEKTGLVVKNSASEADIIPVSDKTSMGGFVAEVHSGSFENCHSVGSGITSPNGDAGGFVGVARGNVDFITCMTNRNVQAASNAGGFIGRQDEGTIGFYDCSAGGHVSGAYMVGDFAGALVADKTELVDCTVSGEGAGGRLVGVWR